MRSPRCAQPKAIKSQLLRFDNSWLKLWKVYESNRHSTSPKRKEARELTLSWAIKTSSYTRLTAAARGSQCCCFVCISEACRLSCAANGVIKVHRSESRGTRCANGWMVDLPVLLRTFRNHLERSRSTCRAREGSRVEAGAEDWRSAVVQVHIHYHILCRNPSRTFPTFNGDYKVEIIRKTNSQHKVGFSCPLRRLQSDKFVY